MKSLKSESNCLFCKLSELINHLTKKLNPMNKQIFTLSFLALMLSSCATLFTRGSDTISFNSDPSGATVYLNGVQLCKTPCLIPIKRELGDTDVQISLEGYETRILSLNKSLNVVSILNLGNLLGWAIDAATGAIMTYDMKQYQVDLRKDKQMSSALKSSYEIHINEEDKTLDVYVLE